ncbi:putative metalloendopeptidase [Candidatus Termititenax spirochaetophilus]|uniref:Metalloendopeptidase n=1 Tax=Candidatus Termititenax spirochaetophilus TaxID=2218522 RepID=A0A388T6I6_9BACT|nr:putative metalloendopeptidase [Candidatus Termititenax spirochaetophilus]
MVMKQAKRNLIHSNYITFAFCPSDRFAPVYLRLSYFALAVFCGLAVLFSIFTFYMSRNGQNLLLATADYKSIIAQNQLLHTKIRIATDKQAQFKAHIHSLKTQEEEIKELLNHSFAEIQPTTVEQNYPQITTHRIVARNGEFGRVLINNKVIVEYFDDKLKPEAYQRAMVTSEKLKELLASGASIQKFQLRKVGNSVYAYINNQPIFVVLNSDLAHLKEPMTAEKLADLWLKDIKNSLALADQKNTNSWTGKFAMFSKERRQNSKIYKTLYPTIDYPAYAVVLDSTEINNQVKQVEHQLKLSQQEISTYRKSFQELKDSVQTYRYRFDFTPSMFPVHNSYIVSQFGWRQHPILNVHRMHYGVDLPSWHGAPIHSTASGTVKRVGWNAYGYGNYIEIDHGNGFSTLYGHNSENLVEEGDVVEKGQLIAKVGSTGLAAGDHCHYEVHYFDRPVNPVRFLNLNVFTANQNL